MDPARLTATGTLYQLWADSRTVANAIFVLMVLAGGVIVLGFETLQSRYAIKQIAPRLLWGWLAANLSWPLLTTLTQLAAAIAVAVAGTNLHPPQILGQLVNATLTDGPTFMVILAGVVAVLALVLTLTLIVIIAVLLGLTVAAPLALCLHALPQTEAIAWWWWRAFAGALAVPTLHALLLALLARVLLTPGGLALGALGLPVAGAAPGTLVNLLVVIALLYLMIKIPGWVLRAATGTSARRGGLLRGALSSVALTAGLSALGVPLPIAGLAGRGGLGRGLAGGFGGSRAGWATLGLRAAASGQPGRRTASRASASSAAASSARSAASAARSAGSRGGAGTAAPRPAPPGSSPAPAAGGGPTAQPDPYARIRVNRDGQLLLPLHGLSHHRATSAPAGTAPPPGQPGPGTATTARSVSSPPHRRPRGQTGRQLSLPLGRDWPEHRPVLGRDGQYQLPIRSPRTARSVARPDTARAATRNLGGDPQQPWPVSRPGPGQLRLPLIWPRRRHTTRGHTPEPATPTDRDTGTRERGSR
jgi:hypothetical protein